MLDSCDRGGVLTMPNWFLLEGALSAHPRRGWSELAGPDWAATTIAYTELTATWSFDPPRASP